MQILSIILHIIYTCWAWISDWFNLDNKDDLQSLKYKLESVELYVNTVEYTSMAMIPIQICLIIMLKCCCNDCKKCRNNIEEPDPDDMFMDKNMKSMSMKRSEFIL